MPSPFRQQIIFSATRTRHSFLMLPVPAVMRELQVQAPYAHLFRRVPAESPAEEATDAPPGSTAFCASERRTGPKNATLRPHAAPRLLHISRPLTKAHKNVRRSKTRFLSVGHLCRLHNASAGKTHPPRHCEATDSEVAGARLMKKPPGKKPGHVFSPKNALTDVFFFTIIV